MQKAGTFGGPEFGRRRLYQNKSRGKFEAQILGEFWVPDLLGRLYIFATHGSKKSVGSLRTWNISDAGRFLCQGQGYLRAHLEGSHAKGPSAATTGAPIASARVLHAWAVGPVHSSLKEGPGALLATAGTPARQWGQPPFLRSGCESNPAGFALRGVSVVSLSKLAFAG